MRSSSSLLLVNEIVDDSTVSDGFVSWERCNQFSRIRSLSPKKRKPHSEAAKDHEFALGKEEDSRGRKRYRPSSEEEQYPNSKIQLRKLSHHRSPKIQPTARRQDLSQPLGFPNNVGQSYSIRSTASPTDMPSTPTSHTPEHGNDSHTISSNTHTSAVQTWLANERYRSDPSGNCEKEKAWAKEMWKGNEALDEKAARRWLEICGAEFH